MSYGIQFKDNLLVIYFFFKSSRGSDIQQKTNVCDTQSQDEVESTANLNFQIYTIAQVLTLTFCLPPAKRTKVFCLT